MRHVRQWDQGEFSAQRPLCYSGWPNRRERPSSFEFTEQDFSEIPPAGRINHARLFYKKGWTAVIFWNQDIYFTDETLTFDGMIELVRSRFSEKFYLQAQVEREYAD